MNEELERRLVSALERAEKSAVPVWKKPGFWVSWLTLITVLCGGMFFVIDLVLEKKFEDFSSTRGAYAVEKRITGTDLAKLAAADQRHDLALASIDEKLGEIKRKLDTTPRAN